MSVDNKTSTLYDAAMEEVTKSGQAWKSICRLTGQLYRYEFDNILMFSLFPEPCGIGFHGVPVKFPGKAALLPSGIGYVKNVPHLWV